MAQDIGLQIGRAFFGGIQAGEEEKRKKRQEEFSREMDRAKMGLQRGKLRLSEQQLEQERERLGFEREREGRLTKEQVLGARANLFDALSKASPRTGAQMFDAVTRMAEDPNNPLHGVFSESDTAFMRALALDKEGAFSAKMRDKAIKMIQEGKGDDIMPNLKMSARDFFEATDESLAPVFQARQRAKIKAEFGQPDTVDDSKLLAEARRIVEAQTGTGFGLTELTEEEFNNQVARAFAFLKQQLGRGDDGVGDAVGGLTQEDLQDLLEDL